MGEDGRIVCESTTASPESQQIKTCIATDADSAPCHDEILAQGFAHPGEPRAEHPRPVAKRGAHSVELARAFGFATVSARAAQCSAGSFGTGDWVAPNGSC
mmetsp:Transcript_16475/g.37814  ORF Transcript_16475/g.37814 Transcript_16475/m.37814 type:complete len:101 (+) Transcript_16475:460-762(+)